ncbi:MAG: AraC family transcriptional regulator [Neptuniibacter sp.]
MVMTATSSGGWVVAIARALETYNIKIEPIFEKAGVDLEAAWDPNARFEVLKTTRLFHLALKECEDPCFGLTVGRMMRPPSWHALGYSLWASKDMREALDRIVKFMKIFTTSAFAGIEESEDRVRLWGKAYPAYRPVLSDAQYEAFLATLILTFRHLYPGTFRPLKIGLTRKEPLEDMSRFERTFKSPMVFGQDSIWFEIDRNTAYERLPTFNAELAQTNDMLCAQYIARFDKSDLLSQVFYLLLETLVDGEPAMEDIADSLNVSTRTMQRKLKDQGTSFKALLDDVRKELSLQYIQQSHMPLGEISYRLGFSHVSNFSRAFKRWTQLSPAEWRDIKSSGK